MNASNIQIHSARRWSPATVGSLFGLLLAAITTPAVSLSIDPASATRTVGQTVSLDIVIAGLGDGTAPSLGAFDLTAAFDPAILAFASLTFGGQLSLTGPSLDGLTVDGSLGSVNLYSISLDPAVDLDAAQASAFILGTIQFLTLAPGHSDVAWTSIILADADGGPLDALAQGARITVLPHTSVPDAGASSGLLALGLAATLAARQNFRRGA